MAKQTWRWPWQKPEPKPVRPPKVAGTRAPSAVESIDFAKPHNFHFRLGHSDKTTTVFESCTLVGFTTPMDDDASTPIYEEYTHNRWIVLQRPDGRRVYIPRDSLVYIEDSENDDATRHDNLG